MGDLVLGPFTVGIDNVSPDTALPKGAVRDAVNGNFNRTGQFESRAGFELAMAASNVHSLWTSPSGMTLCGNGAALCRVTVDDLGDLHLTQIAVTGSAAPFSFCELMTGILYTNPAGTGIIDRGGAVSEIAPQTPPTPAATPVHNGGLSAGAYGIAVSVQRAQESALSPITFIDVDAGGGIRLDFAANSGNKLVYRTTANGDVLYLAASLPEAITTYTLGNSEVGRVAETRNLAPLLGGQIIRYWRGRVLLACGNAIYISEPMRYGLYSPRDGFVQFASRVTMMEPVDGGIFVGNQQGVVFLSGSKPSEWSIDSTSALPPFEGSGSLVPAAIFGGDIGKSGDNVAVWLAKNGFVLGTAQGQIIETQGDRIEIADGSLRASTFVHDRRLTTILQ